MSLIDNSTGDHKYIKKKFLLFLKTIMSISFPNKLLKSSDVVRFVHLPFGKGTIVPFNMSFGDTQLCKIVVNNKDNTYYYIRSSIQVITI